MPCGHQIISISEIPTTSLPTTTLTPPIVTSKLPTPTDISLPNLPVDLSGPFEAPYLMVPIDRAEPDTVLGNRYIAQLDSTHSTLYNFDIPPEYQGKNCNLVFHVPPESQEWWQPWHMTAPGGIVVSQLEAPATKFTSSSNAGASKPVGAVNLLAPGQGHLVSSSPCEAGKKVGYRADALGALDLQYFQLANPPSGLFITVS